MSRETHEGFAIRFIDLSREQYVALCDGISVASDLIDRDSGEV